MDYLNTGNLAASSSSSISLIPLCVCVCVCFHQPSTEPIPSLPSPRPLPVTPKPVRRIELSTDPAKPLLAQGRLLVCLPSLGSSKQVEK
ncbi:hypothetical protein CGGC5_v006170 [Colletotrichum fructicola Nara gc5]|uniref:Uncharacterized protein n=1 Tax=Colletotrichum fructicola (strain Nara gc5) TaxID=1213859 RepID=A0A7J6JCB1_COLFN|nr:hypothetical protein CGGC5_v006170 [Colletotrichum fructicola Nara gc5]KAF5485522.1 hypothetical protein CGCF413_v013752 [Colletotrichum fructicola]